MATQRPNDFATLFTVSLVSALGQKQKLIVARKQLPERLLSAAWLTVLFRRRSEMPKLIEHKDIVPLDPDLRDLAFVDSQNPNKR